jgi:hypothetical protein
VCRVSCVVCRVSCVVCRVSCVVCRVSCASCQPTNTTGECGGSGGAPSSWCDQVVGGDEHFVDGRIELGVDVLVEQREDPPLEQLLVDLPDLSLDLDGADGVDLGLGPDLAQVRGRDVGVPLQDGQGNVPQLLEAWPPPTITCEQDVCACACAVVCVVCRVSCVVCRVSCVVCRVSCVVCRVCVVSTDVGEGGLEQPLQAVDGQGVYAIGELGTQLGQDAHIHLCARHLDHTFTFVC